MIGIDAKIERVRTLFEQELFLDYSYNSYGRAFINERDGKKIPERYVSDNEYQEVLLNDRVACTSFFSVENDYTVDRNLLSGTVNIYFSCNLSTVYPSVSERAVEYLHRDVSAILKRESFELTGITSGADAFSDFDFSDNMQPFYLVRFKTETSWLIGECVELPNDAIITQGGLFITTQSDKLIIIQ